MKKSIHSQTGFTLLELLISLTIIALLVGTTMLGVRLAVSTKDVADNKTETFQRLRFISEQLNSKIRSMHPLFIQSRPEETSLGSFDDSQTLGAPQKILAFEGKPDSIRLITFSQPLTAVKLSPGIHEVRIYLGTHPETGEAGLLISERQTSILELFKDNPKTKSEEQTLLIAPKVAYLQFRYYLMQAAVPETTASSGDNLVKYSAAWVDKVTTEPFDLNGNNTLFRERDLTGEFVSGRSLPRAVEVSIGLWPAGSDELESELIYLPATIISINSGMVFERPASVEDENEPL